MATFSSLDPALDNPIVNVEFTELNSPALTAVTAYDSIMPCRDRR